MNTTYYTTAEKNAIKNALLAYKITVGSINHPVESEDKYQDICSALSKFNSDIKSAETDPCRLFKKGDKVEYRPKDGRANPNLLVGRRYKVSADEPCDSGIVQVECDGLRHINTFVAYNNLELVTPVEELERYVVEPGDVAYFVVDKKRESGEQNVVMYMYALHPNAKAAAEAECARLNAEYRKEMEK